MCLRSLASLIMSCSCFVHAFLKAALVVVRIEAQCLFTLCAGPGREVRVFDGRTEGKIVEARGPEARRVGRVELALDMCEAPQKQPENTSLCDQSLCKRSFRGGFRLGSNIRTPGGRWQNLRRADDTWHGTPRAILRCRKLRISKQQWSSPIPLAYHRLG